MIDLRRLKEGDHEYFEVLVRTHGPLVLRVCLAYGDSEDDAADLFQRVWIQVYEKRNSFRGNGSFESWLHRLAKNLCISELRKRRVRREGQAALTGDPQGEELQWRSADPLAEMERKELHGEFFRALDELTEREQAAIRLRVLDGRTTAAVAEIMGIRPSTVRSNIRHGINRLREIMGRSE